MRKKRIGSSFEDFLKEEGVFEETTTRAIKRVLAWQVSQAMKRKGISKMEMAKRMRTSRSQLDRFLDPNNDKVLLVTVHRAASAIGKRVSMTLEDEWLNAMAKGAEEKEMSTETVKIFKSNLTNKDKEFIEALRRYFSGSEAHISKLPELRGWDREKFAELFWALKEAPPIVRDLTPEALQTMREILAAQKKQADDKEKTK